MQNFNRLAYFVAVVEEGSITAAATRMNISKAVVSKQVQLLEEELGNALLFRSTRKVSPTEYGQRLYEQGKPALNQITEAFQKVQEGSDQPRGTLRITAPLDYGTLHIASLVARFAKAFPDVEVTLHLTDQQVDLIGERYDLGFRVGWLQDSSYHAQKVGGFEEVAVVSARFTEQLAHPDDLNQFPIIANTALATPDQWMLSRGEDRVYITSKIAMKMNSGPAIIKAVEAGLGYAILPDFLVSEGIQAGTLRRVVPAWSLRTGGIYAVSPPAKYKPRAVREFINRAGAHHRAIR